jgi:undecaprenyl-phosphate alpha-N-acetylglucosaminyl 1-phosphatetransferase
MTWIITPLAVSLISLVIIAVLPRAAERHGLIDRPNQRKVHSAAVPAIGGIAIYSVMILTMGVVGLPEKISWIFISATILVVIGAIDDARGLSALLRLFFQILATIVMILASDLWIRSVGLINSGHEIFAWLAIPFTVVSVVGLSNGFNFIDGIDGLASGHLLIGILTIFGVSVVVDGPSSQIYWLVLLFSSVFVFWLVNLSLTPLSRVFLGDAGSSFLGFTMAWVLIYYTQEPVAMFHPVVALWCVTIPVYDTISTILRRIINSKSPFVADRTHLHYLLVDIGINPRVVLWFILLGSLILNVFGVWVVYTFDPLLSLVVYWFFFWVFNYGSAQLATENSTVMKYFLKLGVLSEAEQTR